jgi:hypothetical protein
MNATINYTSAIKDEVVSSVSLTVESKSELTELQQTELLSDPFETRKNPFLIRLLDASGYEYFYRIWPEDPLHEEEIEKGSVMVFKQVSISKKEDIEGSKAKVNISKNRFTTVAVL